MPESQEKLSRRAFLTKAPVRAAAAGIVTKEAITVASTAVGSALLAACKDEDKGKTPSQKAAVEEEAPKCGDKVEISDNGRASWNAADNVTREDIECARDRYFGRDCSTIRKVGENRINRIPEMYECESGDAKLRKKPSDVVDLSDFGYIPHKGDCTTTIGGIIRRISRVFNRMKCKNGTPVEETGWGQAKGGRVYNPCGGGKC